MTHQGTVRDAASVHFGSEYGHTCCYHADVIYMQTVIVLLLVILEQIHQIIFTCGLLSIILNAVLLHFVETFDSYNVIG